MTNNTKAWKVALLAEFIAYIGTIEVPGAYATRTCTALNSNAKNTLSHNGGQSSPEGFITLKDVNVYHKVKNGSKLQHKLAETAPEKNVHKDKVFVAYDWLDNPGDNTEKYRQKTYEMQNRNLRPQRMNIITDRFEGRTYNIEANIRSFYTQCSHPDITFIPLSNITMQPLEWLVGQEHNKRPWQFSFRGLNKNYISSY